MLKRYFILFLTWLLLLPLLALASKEPIVVTDSIRWEGIRNIQPSPGMSYNMLWFRDAVNQDDWGLLPAYLYRVPVSSGVESVDVKLVERSVSSLDPVEGTSIEDLHLAGQDFQVRTNISTARGEHYLNVYVLPVRKDGPGVIQLLGKFDLVIEKMVADAPAGSRGLEYAGHSVLSAGRWYKIAVQQTGIHRLSYDDLKNMGMDVGSMDPRNIRIYGNGNGMLPEPNSIERPDDLQENAIEVRGEEDGKLDPGDEILFYGEGPVKWQYSNFYQLYSHELNLYTERTYYFITSDLGPGLRVREESTPPGIPTDTVRNYDIFIGHEKDEVNLIKSGKEWFGDSFGNKEVHDFVFEVPDLVTDHPVKMKVNFVTRSTETSTFYIYAEDELLAAEEMAGIPLSSPVYGRSRIPNVYEFMPDDKVLDIRMEYPKPTTTSSAWLNYIELNAKGILRFEGGQKSFRNAETANMPGPVKYEVTTQTSAVTVWDVTRSADIRSLSIDPREGGVGITALGDTLREFIIFDGSHYHGVEFAGEVENQDLHALEPYEFIIVAYPDFLAEAERLAQHHREHDGLTVYVTTPEKIFNEFASGAPDPTAIRDFMRMLYLKVAEDKRPRYLLLFGDGSYDYKDRIPDNHNLIPTFQSKESLKYPASYVTDDYFGCFDLNEGSNAAGDLDIGIGRFPVVSIQQAANAVDKVIHYATETRDNMGQWRNRICFIADDEDGNLHLRQADDLGLIVDTSDATFNLSKIYFDAYTQVVTTAGDRYPDVSNAIDKAVNDGVLIMNYTGHGGELGWSDERVLTMGMINGWRNMDNLPVFVTATCEFSRFDDPLLTSAGEMVFLNPHGGGVALYTTTRLAYAQSNFGLNKKFYEHAFDFNEEAQEYVRLGDMIRNAKTPSNSNIKNFVLLGDPALMIAYPRKEVVTTSMINENTQEEIDTLRSLSKVTVHGRILDREGSPVENMNGLIYPVIYDKPVTYRTLGNDAASNPTDFVLRDRVIFSGKATVTNGVFDFTFVVPRDISYSFGKGKISYYAVDTVNFIDYHGAGMVMIGGIDPDPGVDTEGPEIELFLNNLGFVSGDLTTNDPVLLAFLSDESGINTVGNGIGHEITAVLNDAHHDPVILNEYFQSDLNTYQSGKIAYPLGHLPDGYYTLTLKAWDVFNNSTEKTIEFRVEAGGEVIVKGVLNYPNPFRHQTRFEFSHNKPGEQVDLRIDIYDLMGSRVRTLEDSFTTEYLSSEPLFWDGRSDDGELLPSGIYIYNIFVQSEQSSPVRLTNKLMIVR